MSHLHAETAKPGWTDDAVAALKAAHAGKKLILMDFTGSDWCPSCVQLDKEVFGTPEFKAYAQENLVLLELDFPQKKTLKLETWRQNEKLRQMFGVEIFPTVIVLTADGKPLKAFGDVVGGPKPLIAELKKLKG